MAKKKEKLGVCCRCGYDGKVESDCVREVRGKLKVNEDGHCDHWWDGETEEDEIANALATAPKTTLTKAEGE